MIFTDLTYVAVGMGVALLIIVGMGSHARRRRRLAEFLGGARAGERVSSTNLYALRIRQTGALVAAALALGAAAAEPAWKLPETEPPPPPPERSIVLAIDVSASMQANDAAPTRLGEAVRIAKELLDGLADERVGLVLWAGRAYPLAPPTRDHAALGYLLDGVTPTIASAYDPGSLPSAGIAAAAELLADSASAEGGRAIVLVSDGGGGEASDATLAAARAAAERGIRLYSIGIGTEDGAGMVMPRGEFQLGGRIVDETGSPVITRLNADGLRAVAEAGGGESTRASDANRVQSLIEQLRSPVPAPPPDTPPGLRQRFDPTFWFALAALLLLFAESLADVRPLRRSA